MTTKNLMHGMTKRIRALVLKLNALQNPTLREIVAIKNAIRALS